MWPAERGNDVTAPPPAALAKAGINVRTVLVSTGVLLLGGALVITFIMIGRRRAYRVE